MWLVMRTLYGPNMFCVGVDNLAILVWSCIVWCLTG